MCTLLLQSFSFPQFAAEHCKGKKYGKVAADILYFSLKYMKVVMCQLS